MFFNGLSLYFDSLGADFVFNKLRISQDAQKHETVCMCMPRVCLCLSIQKSGLQIHVHYLNIHINMVHRFLTNTKDAHSCM